MSKPAGRQGCLPHGKLLLILLLAATTAVPQNDTRSVWDGVYTAEQADRGRPLYVKECASCHGDQLTGGEAAPPLAGGVFLSNWNGLTVGDLFERIRKTMPQSKPGKLPRATIADVTAYMLKVNEFPSGKEELSTKPEMLSQIQIESTKPERKP
jgi:S-disulfanyl-L-cysteine oxidoreductase SoxD